MPASLYLMLKDWSERGKDQDLRSLFSELNQRARPRSRRRASSCCRRRRSRASAMPAASPCRSSCATAASTSPSCRASPTRSSSERRRRAACSGCTTSFRADVPQLTVDVDRAKARDAAACRSSTSSRHAQRLSRLELCRPVQQVRAHLPGLRAGRCALSACAPRTSQLLTVRNEQGRHDPDRHPGGDHADGRAVADQPLQSLSVLDHHRPAGAGLQLRRGDRAHGADRRPDAAARRRATNGPRCRTRRSWSAIRSTSSSRWRCCWSIWCSPASTRAGSRRSR